MELTTRLDQCQRQGESNTAVSAEESRIRSLTKGRRHRAATTGSTGFVNILLHPPEGHPKTRLNPADRVGAFPPP